MDYSFLKSINDIIDKYENENKTTGTNINILQIANKDDDEVVICRLIAFLLNPKECHGQKEKFLDLFLQTIGEKGENPVSDDELKSLKVVTEYPTNKNRRIDIVIKSNKRFLPFEVKIDAKDQDEQCKHYYDFSSNQKPVGAEKVFYLTKDGHKPNKSSSAGLEVGKSLVLLSFQEHILKWLKKCEDNSLSQPLKEFLRELIFDIKNFCKLSEDRRMNKEIFALLNNNRDASKLIYEAIKEINDKTTLWNSFWRTIYNSDLFDIDGHQINCKQGEESPLTVSIIDKEDKQIELDFHDEFSYLFLACNNKNISEEIIKELNQRFNFICSDIKPNGFSINNIKTYFFEEDCSEFSMYDFLTNKPDEIKEKMFNIIKTIYNIVK